MHFGKIDMLPSFLLWRIRGPDWATTRSQASISNSNCTTPHKHWKQRRETEKETEKEANLRHDSLRDSCDNRLKLIRYQYYHHIFNGNTYQF